MTGQGGGFAGVVVAGAGPRAGVDAGAGAEPAPGRCRAAALRGAPAVRSSRSRVNSPQAPAGRPCSAPALALLPRPMPGRSEGTPKNAAGDVIEKVTGS